MMHDNSPWVLVSHPHDSYHELLEFGCEPLWHSGTLCMSLSISQKLSTMIFWSFLEKALLWNSNNFVFLSMFYCWWFSSSSKMRFANFSVIFLPPFFQHRPWSVRNWEFHLLSVLTFFFFPDVCECETHVPDSLILVCHEFRIRLDMLLSTHVGGEWCIFTCRPKTIDVILCAPQLHKHSFHWRRFIPTCSIQFLVSYRSPVFLHNTAVAQPQWFHQHQKLWVQGKVI